MIGLLKSWRFYVVCIFVFVLIFIYFLFSFLNQSKKELSIINYDQFVKNLQPENKQSIFNSLYIRVASSGIKPDNVKDAKIRINSEKQDYIKEDFLYYGSFIVDIDSIRHSYRVNYSFSKDKNKQLLYPNGLVIKCLKEEEIIYKEFICEDDSIKQETADIYLNTSSFDLSYTEPADSILTFRNKNQVKIDLDLFIKDYIKKGVDSAVMDSCNYDEAGYYQCSINVNPEIVLLKLYTDERLNPLKYVLSYGTNSKEYTIKL